MLYPSFNKHLASPALSIGRGLLCATALVAIQASAQVTPLQTGAPEEVAPQPAQANDSKRLLQEQGSARIDEVRHGAQTQSITVTPKGGILPQYDVRPATTTSPLEITAPSANAGARTWSLFKF